MSTPDRERSEETTVGALVPARGGSKSIPGKNLELLGEKPLVAWPIDTANSTPEIDEVFLTTDDEDIASAGREFGATVIERPAALATDDALVIDAIVHAVEWMEERDAVPDRLTLLEPTCPFRAVEDVQACLGRLDDGYDSAATFVEAAVNPHRTWTLDDGEPETFVEGANPWLPRQELPEAYQLNGGCYAFETAAVDRADGPGLLFGRSAGVRMPPERSVDIDSPVDLTVARTLVEEGRQGES